ncbi:MAG: (2Fe-2S)-binding protein [Candidatus Planktophila sp.]|nr:(2Fe-2S)-binding protein [Candidatus Planktophila sp.]MSO24451.1 (2Fe-2S)-binding protein [Candidatus Planktophila sp.]PHX70112.1 MAG: proline dehydrogenase [Actinomycetota bacterium]
MSESTGADLSFTFNGDCYEGAPGQSIAAALMASGVRELRTTRFHKEPRLIFCGIGVCFDCVVVVNGVANQRACLVEINQGDEIVSSK